MPTAVTQQTVHFIKPAKTAVPADETWSRQSIEDLFNLPFNDLLYKAQQIHREHFNPNEVQLSTLLSIKTGGCPEDCGYCPQSVHYDTGVEASKMLDVDAVKAAAVEAKKNGASRFCMGAAWREPKDRDIEKVAELIRAVKDLDMEACCTLGMLSATQADTLKDAGLDYYNHNLDTAPELYGDIISTRFKVLDVVVEQVPAARALARRIAEKLNYVGVFAIEFFASDEGPVFNEMAPRVHNSGHWTIEGAATSQFENHIRAICGLPLGATDTVAERVEMENLIGDDGDRFEQILSDPAASLHLYGKAEARPGRKIGHVTRLYR